MFTHVVHHVHLSIIYHFSTLQTIRLFLSYRKRQWVRFID